MEHKIVSEYDRVHVDNSFPVESEPVPDLSSYGTHKRPRFWLPRRALALAALILMLTTLAAVLWPGSFHGILHGNRDISQIGVPVGVPEPSSAPDPGVSSPTERNVAQQDAEPANPAASSVISTNQQTEIASNNQDSGPEPERRRRSDDSAAATDNHLQRKQPRRRTQILSRMVPLTMSQQSPLHLSLNSQMRHRQKRKLSLPNQR